MKGKKKKNGERREIYRIERIQIIVGRGDYYYICQVFKKK